MRIYDNNLPEHHVVETPVIEFEVKPGQTREALVRILPKRRPIRFIDGGSIGPVTMLRPLRSEAGASPSRFRDANRADRFCRAEPKDRTDAETKTPIS
jgi:hypothetical protein